MTVDGLKADPQNCPTYPQTALDLHGQGATPGEQSTKDGWSLATVLACLSTPVQLVAGAQRGRRPRERDPGAGAVARRPRHAERLPGLLGGPDRLQRRDEPQLLPPVARRHRQQRAGLLVVFRRRSRSRCSKGRRSPSACPPRSKRSRRAPPSASPPPCSTPRTPGSPIDGSSMAAPRTQAEVDTTTAQFSNQGDYHVTVEVTDAAGGGGDAVERHHGQRKRSAAADEHDPETAVRISSHGTTARRYHRPRRTAGTPGSGQRQHRRRSERQPARTRTKHTNHTTSPNHKQPHHTTKTRTPQTPTNPSTSAQTNPNPSQTGGSGTTPQSPTPTPTTPAHSSSPKGAKAPHHRLKAPVTTPGRVVTGRLVSDVIPLPVDEQSARPHRAGLGARRPTPPRHEDDAHPRTRGCARDCSTAGPRRRARAAWPARLAGAAFRRLSPQAIADSDLRAQHEPDRPGDLPRRQRARGTGADPRAAGARARHLRAR